jgi:glycine/serine hydroxymethyltransferase
MQQVADLLDRVLTAQGQDTQVRADVKSLCDQFPLPH